MDNKKKNAMKLVALSIGLTAMLGFSHGAEGKIHEVKSGDTLYRIALENQMTVSEVKKMNNLTSNIIVPGQKIKLKESAVTYQVKKGDTLYSISKKHQMTVDELKQLNDLHSNLIFSGQKLVVKQPASNEVIVTTKTGYQFVQEEPGKYQLFSKKDDGFFVRIEVLDSKAKIKDMKQNAQDYLKITGTVHEIKNTNQLHPFYHQTKLYMTSSNSNVRQSVVIKKIDGQLVKFTLHLLDKEEAEDITPNLLNQLQTVRF